MTNVPYYRNNENLRFEMVTPEEETRLFKLAKAGDDVAREFLIRNHLLFAKTCASRRVAGRISDDEVTSAANYALMVAFDRFSPERGFRFTTYFRHVLKGAVSALWKSKFSGGVPDPSMGGPSGETLTRTRNIAEGKDIAPTAENTLELSEPHAFEQLDLDRFNRAALAKALSELTDRERNIIRMIYEDGKSKSDVGVEYGVTREMGRLMHKAVIKKLRSKLEKAGVER